MSEIERAIAYWEEFEREIDEMPHSDVLEAQREPVKTALTVLHAEIDREKNDPLTEEEFCALSSKDPAFGTHCFVKILQTGIIYHALADVDSTGVVAVIGAQDTFSLDTYGTYWLSYRYEPKGEKA